MFNFDGTELSVRYFDWPTLARYHPHCLPIDPHVTDMSNTPTVNPFVDGQTDSIFTAVCTVCNSQTFWTEQGVILCFTEMELGATQQGA